jgi:hypothetical protein
MTNLSAQDIAKKWSTNLGASTSQIQAGVQGVTTAPGQSAARQKNAWAQNVAAAKDKWAASVASVSLTDWQDAMINKGVARVASGASAAQDKFSSFMGKLIPFEQNAVNSLPERGNLDQNIARAEQFMRKMSTFKK